MQTSMLTDAQATGTLERLIRECNRFDVSVAWAGVNLVVTAMLNAHKKIGRVTIGTHMYQTDPAILRKFMPFKGARCMPPDGRLFHPKVYFFSMESGVSAVVGSHNLTGGAFGGKNIEVSVLLEGVAEEQVFGDLKAFVQDSWTKAEAIDEDSFLFAYEAQYKLNKDKRKALDNFYRLKKPKAGAKTSPLDLTWPKFVAGVKNDSNHSLVGRLDILRRAAELFVEKTSFSAMSRDERKAIAGTYAPTEETLEGLPWLWFGAMSGHGDLKNLVNENPKGLSTALSHIPAEGDVSEGEFNEFSKFFVKAFENKAHRGRIATASRLLAMKRPDFFVAVNDANRDGVCKAFGCAPTTLDMDNYWERIIIPLQNSPFWLAPRPRGSLGGRIWDNRAALLDSIYYEPKPKKKTKV